MAGNDENDFESMMRQLGVDKIPGGRAKPDTARRKPAQRSRQPAGSRPAPVVVKQVTSPPELPPEVVALRRQRDELAAELAKLNDKHTSVAAELDDLKAAHAKLQGQADRVDHERRALQRKLTEQAQAQPVVRSATALLAARNLDGPKERAAAIAGLADRYPSELIDSLLLGDGAPFARLLDRRIALVGETTDATIESGAVAVTVSTDRCELGGPGAVNAAWRRFAAACEKASIHRLAVVGGSPAYRKQLRQCASETGVGPRVDLVSGTKRRPAHKAASDLRSSDLVLIWAATELDHAVSAPYTDARSDKVHIIAHRGISGMLAAATDVVSSRLGP